MVNVDRYGGLGADGYTYIFFYLLERVAKMSDVTRKEKFINSSVPVRNVGINASVQ